MAVWQRYWPVLVWAGFTLGLAPFHEPWRDEAQAWLVAQSATSLGDLALRASAEATGPVYYLLLWPWARGMPGAFPSAIFWVSWVGTLLLVFRVVQRRSDAAGFLFLLLGGYLLFYEYAALSRLYGWGGFFLLSGMRADEQGNPRRAVGWFALACLTQLTFALAVLTWVAGGWWTPERRRWGVGVGVALGMMALHLAWGASLRPWSPPGWAGLGWVPLGTTLGTLVLPAGFPLGVVGYAVFGLGIWLLPRSRRLAFGGGALLYVLLFSVAYAGSAQARHGGALVWVWWVWCLGENRSRSCFNVLLGLSVIAAVWAWIQEVRFPYSHGQGAAQAVRQWQGDRTLFLSVNQDIFGFVVSASLNRPLNGVGCPFTSAPCGSAPPSRPVRCSPTEAWAHVAHDPGPPPPAVLGGKWMRLWGPGGRVLTDERLQVYGLHCEM